MLLFLLPLVVRTQIYIWKQALGVGSDDSEEEAEGDDAEGAPAVPFAGQVRTAPPFRKNTTCKTTVSLRPCRDFR